MVDELPPDFHHVTLTPDGQTMYLQGPLDNGRCGLFVSKKAAKKWGQPTPLDVTERRLGTEGRPLTLPEPDGRRCISPPTATAAKAVSTCIRFTWRI